MISSLRNSCTTCVKSCCGCGQAARACVGKPKSQQRRREALVLVLGGRRPMRDWGRGHTKGRQRAVLDSVRCGLKLLIAQWHDEREAVELLASLLAGELRDASTIDVIEAAQQAAASLRRDHGWVIDNTSPTFRELSAAETKATVAHRDLKCEAQELEMRVERSSGASVRLAVVAPAALWYACCVRIWRVWSGCGPLAW